MYKIILVDDEALVRETVSEHIPWKELGYILTAVCKNGRDAAEVIKNDPPDVVLTDICMPFMDGLELSRFICENNLKIKIVIFSGYDDFTYARQAVKYKVEEYLLKPVTASELSDLLIRIRESLDKEKKERAQISRIKAENHKNQPLVVTQVLRDLLLRNKEEKEHEEELKDAGIFLSLSNMQVVVIDIMEEDRIIREQSAILLFAMLNIVQEIMESKKLGIAFQSSDRQIAMIFSSNYPRDFSENVRKCLEEVQKRLEEYIHFRILIGVGHVVHALLELHDSWQTALTLCERGYLFPKGGIFYGETSRGVVLDMDAGMQKHYVDMLVLAVQTGEEEEIVEILSHFVKTCKEKYLAKEQVLLEFQRLISGLHQIFEKSDMKKENYLKEENQLLGEIWEKNNIEEAADVFRRHCIKVGNLLKEKQMSTRHRQVLQAQNFILEHYHESELGLPDICAHLAISQSYFSALYKNDTGETFLDTLVKVRIGKAKELLEHTELKNYEVADRVGFRDPHYFNIVFKKETGMTPKEYAKIRKREKDV